MSKANQTVTLGILQVYQRRTGSWARLLYTRLARGYWGSQHCHHPSPLHHCTASNLQAHTQTLYIACTHICRHMDSIHTHTRTHTQTHTHIRDIKDFLTDLLIKCNTVHSRGKPFPVQISPICLIHKELFSCHINYSMMRFHLMSDIISVSVSWQIVLATPSKVAVTVQYTVECG